MRVNTVRESWTIPLDPHGLVIYFGVQQRPFFFNGHTGAFYDSLPRGSVRALNTLLDSEARLPAAERAGCLKSEARRSGFWREIQQYQDGAHPDLLPEARQVSFREKVDWQEILVYVTRACNLACTYCFSQGGTFGGRPSVMSVETAKEAVAFVGKLLATSARPYITVDLFGGEPLLARAAVYTLARGLQDLNRSGLPTKVKIRVLTNGTVYDQKTFEVLAEEPDLNVVFVTFDAFREAQEKNRPFRGRARASSYDAVLGNLQRIMGAGIPYAVSCQVPYPYNYIGAADELHRLGVEQLEIRLLLHHVFGRADLPAVFEDDIELWKKQYLAYTDYFLEYLSNPRRSRHIDRRSVFGDYAKALRQAHGSPQTLGCGLVEDLMAIGCDGRLLPCHCFPQEELEIGHVRTGIDAPRYARIAQWLLAEAQLRIDHERCRNCYAKRICCGGCYAASYDRAGRFEPLPESSCQFTREKVKIDLYFISRMRKEHPELLPPATQT
jgi:uncharacterized protein